MRNNTRRMNAAKIERERREREMTAPVEEFADSELWAVVYRLQTRASEVARAIAHGVNQTAEAERIAERIRALCAEQAARR
jgi:hypothetical protein